MLDVYTLDLPVKEAVDHLLATTQDRYNDRIIRANLMFLFVETLESCNDGDSIGEKFRKAFEKKINLNHFECNKGSIKIKLDTNIGVSLEVHQGNIWEEINFLSWNQSSNLDMQQALKNANELKQTRIDQLNEIRPRKRASIKKDFLKVKSKFQKFAEEVEAFRNEYPEMQHELKTYFTKNSETGKLIYLADIIK